MPFAKGYRPWNAPSDWAPENRVTARPCETCGMPQDNYNKRFCSMACRSAWGTHNATGKFWERVAKSDGCWFWMGAKNKEGYGGFQRGGHSSKTERAHRVSWELHNGPIPEGLFVCHRCDNPSCVNPDHLFLGTPADNTADMMRKERNRPPLVRGEKNGIAKLNNIQVAAIRADPRSSRDIAADYGVAHTTVNKIKARHTWGHLP